jgi:hypothetical protein
MTVSIDDFRYRDEATLEVIPPGGSAPIATITFAGPGHPAARQQAERLHQRDAYRARSARAVNRSLEMVERENCEFLADRMVGWSGISRRDDAGQVVQIPFSREAAIEMLGNPALGWLFGQCLAFISTDTSFLPASVRGTVPAGQPAAE